MYVGHLRGAETDARVTAYRTSNARWALRTASACVLVQALSAANGLSSERPSGVTVRHPGRRTVDDAPFHDPVALEAPHALR